MNAANALQAISLAGIGSAAPTTLVLSVPLNATYGNPVQVAASVGNSQAKSAINSGTVAFSDQNGSLGSITVINGSTTQSYLAPSIGSFTLSGTFTPLNSNYSSASGQATIQITAAQLDLLANGASRMYGAANPQFTGSMSSAANGDILTKTFKTSATASSPVDSYPIVPSAAGPNLANYAQTAVNGVLTITPATLTLSADSLTHIYGAANPTLTGSFSGSTAGDLFQQGYSTAAVSASPVGSYGIIPAITGASVSSYVQVVKPGVMAITQATLHLTANNATRPYGAQNPTFVGSIAGLAASDTAVETFTTAATASSLPGTYPIVPSVTGSALINYLSTATNGTLTITVIPLTATVQNVTRFYSAANPDFKGAITGAVNRDSFTETFTTSATSQSPVGSYPVKPVLAGEALGNYTPALLEGILTAAPAPLIATARNATRVYGTVNPVLSGSLLGVVNGETLLTSYSTTAQLTDAVGQYPIMASVTGSALGNYSLSIVPGVLTVKKQTHPRLSTRREPQRQTAQFRCRRT